MRPKTIVIVTLGGRPRTAEAAFALTSLALASWCLDRTERALRAAHARRTKP